MPFIINEDEALKKHMSGLTVSDQNDSTRPVKVWYRLPQAEERQITYPFITLDLLDIEEEPDRAHRGGIIPRYQPEGVSLPASDAENLTEFPIPVSLVYQVTTFTRSAWHDRQLQGQIIANKIPLRFGYLEVEADQTIRRMDFLDMQQVDGLDRNDKRVFRKAYTIAVSSELFPEAIYEVKTVAEVGITVYSQLEPFIIEQEPVA